MIKQLSTYVSFGSANVINLSVENDYGINLLTVDNIQVEKTESASEIV